ncbi:MAG: hypothetical protein EXR98_24240 [Gemmataceae bacterium]|nr:hypothetical protein [Gemmataceae bacterium]
MRPLLLTTALLALCPSIEIGGFLLTLNSAAAGEPVHPGTARFDEAVAPFLKEHCLRCHGPAKQVASSS